ncbi:MAG TPA: hypothetical protein VN881_01325, partial [Candidatus Acidoferrales bacterium]|nr:hypothetical protein [Candidatus Acidoferrales bacterium]
NPVPLIVNGKPGQPAPTLWSEVDAIAGAGFELNGVTVNGLVDEVPPPGVGFMTDTFSVAAEANVLAAIAAVTCAPLIKLVACALPFTCTTDWGKNPEPFTFNTNGAAPACALTGVIEETEGTEKLTLKPTELEMCPPGLVTETEVEPALLTKDEGTAAVIVVLFTKVALNGVGALKTPSQVTVGFASKFEPVKVRVKLADPTIAVVGEIEAIAGIRFGGGGGGNCTFEPFPPQLARPDAANNKKRAYIVRERALLLAMDLHILLFMRPPL